MKKIFVLFVSIILIGTLAMDARSFNLKIGTFWPDMKSDLWDENLYDLTFDKEDMRGLYLGAEFEVFMNRYASFSLEAGHYSKKIYTIYSQYELDDGTALNHDINLSIYSFEAGMKLYPMGHRGVFNPYIGAGVGLYAWKYIQGGDFIDYDDYSVYEGEAVTETVTPGFFGKAGFVYRFQRSVGISFEAKYTYLKGNLSELFEGYGKLDLNGLTLSVGVNLFLN